MKKTKYIFLGLLALSAVACKKSVITQFGDVKTGTNLKFVQTAPGLPAVDGYVNGTKITPSQSLSVTDNSLTTSITTGIIYNYTGSTTTYLGLFPGSNYAVVGSGATAIKVVTTTNVPALATAQTSAPGTTIGSVTQNTSDDSYYTIFTLGLPGSATAPVGIKVIEDKFTQTDGTKAYVRFANMIPNATSALDLASTVTLTGASAATTTTFATNVAYGSASDFIAVPVNSSGLSSYTFQAYATATTTKVGAVSSTVSLAPGRYYTIIGRGLAADYAVPGTTITLKASARPATSTLPEIYFAPAQLVFYTNK
ncbi:DUF4397 domain-containing protein [Mucilaginibacter ginkgonis]|uniref:DUF4397 domain-containing protein n=1 Tax=Mucilaginibacter ginkgonis TaxID=2682091 RepID=A0A6I4I3H9_9SPHI|nr:DUF4397 domain-containing protein [Mucilaginibacter ginkgonis]QQL49227.1 DUF4397 domain-containing protein [Mucilaginibacter ginkgonis]